MHQASTLPAGRVTPLPPPTPSSSSASEPLPPRPSGTQVLIHVLDEARKGARALLVIVRLPVAI
jgi:hypothetical protein